MIRKFWFGLVIRIYISVVIALITLILNCSKENSNPNPVTPSYSVPILSTAEVRIRKHTTARCGGNITDDDGVLVTARGVCWSTAKSPTIVDNNTNDGRGLGSFSSLLTGLTAGTSYYVRAYATSSAGTGYGNTMWFLAQPFTETIMDIDGNLYHTITVGTHEWMVENLRGTHYRNGDAIPNVTDFNEWENLTTGAYGNYYNDLAMISAYGRLYNWFAVDDTRNIAPEGWHVPSYDEWQILIDYLDDRTVAGGKLKEAGLEHWYSPNTGATNESDFSALPGGYRSYGGWCDGMGRSAFFWSSTRSRYTMYPYNIILNFDNSAVDLINGYYSQYGFSVRCVKD